MLFSDLTSCSKNSLLLLNMATRSRSSTDKPLDLDPIVSLHLDKLSPKTLSDAVLTGLTSLHDSKNS